MNAINELARHAGFGGHLLLYLLAGATAILLLAGIAVLLLRRQSAALRHCVWTVSMMALLALPVVASVLPDLGPRWQQDVTVTESGSEREPALSSPVSYVAERPNPALQFMTGLDRPYGRLPTERGDSLSVPRIDVVGEECDEATVATVGHSEPDPEADARHATDSPSPSEAESPVPRRTSFNGWIALVSVWLAGAVVGLLLFVRCRLAALRVVRRAVPVTDARVIALKEQFRELADLRCEVALLCSSEIPVPLTVGWLRPVILLPAGFARWTEERRRVVLAHEMAHIRRRDVLWELLARLACCFYWCHPLVWVAHWRIRIEREFACDDVVLTLGEVPDRYAGHLVEFAAALAGRTCPPQHAVAMAARSSLEQRVRAILHPCLKRTPVTRRAGRLLAVGALSLVVGVSLMSPSSSRDADAGPQTDDLQETVAEDDGTSGSGETDNSAAEDSKPEIAADGSVPTSGAMRIRVVDAGGSPMEGAKIHVSVWTSEDFEANQDYVCDSDGRTEVRLPGSLRILRIWARSEGCVPLFAQWWPEEHPVDASIPEEFTYRLPEGTLMGGVVRNENGEPIEGVTVEVRRDSGGEDDGRNHYVLGTWLAEGDDDPCGALTTDSEGRWLLNNVPAGDDVEVRLKLSHPDYIDDENWGTMQREQFVTMASLRDQTAVIVMKRGISVTGKVTDPDGEPVSGALAIWGERPYWQPGSQEVRTDEHGIYRLPPLPPGPTTLTIVAEGWMPYLSNVDVQPGMSAVNIELQQGKTLRLRFVDPSGDPIPEVYVQVEEWRGAESLYNYRHPNVQDTGISQRADNDGIYEWTWAPDDAVTYSFGAGEGYARLELPITADDTEQIVTLQPVLQVSGTVTSAETAQPVESFKAVPVLFFQPDFLYVDRDRIVDGSQGRLAITFERTDVEHGVRIEADGYRTQLLGPWKIGDPNPVLEIALEPAPPIQGVVLRPDGQPAADVPVYLGTHTQHLDIQNHEDQDQDLFVRRTDPAGRFSFPAQYEQYALIALDDTGYTDVQCSPDEQPGQLQLRPWARVEGRLMHAGAPIPGQRVTLAPLHPRFFPLPRIDETFRQTTDREGRFVIERVPPIRCSLSGYLSVWDEFPFTSSESVPLDLQPGQTLAIDLNGSGAEVTGRVVLSGQTRREIDLNYSLNYLLDLRDGIEPPPAVTEKGFNWRDGWSDAWTSSLEGLSYMDTLHHYFVKLNRDGTFHISGVPPGDYELALKIYEPPESGCLVQPVATRQVRFTVTNEHIAGGLDLGELTVEAFLGPEPGEPAPDFAFETQGGTKQSLSDLRGKHVLIDFWATWCAPCIEKLPTIREIHDEFAGGDLVVLGMNLDADTDAARQFATSRELPWMQGFLGDWSESAVPVQFGISSIPAYLLIGPDGTFLHKGYDVGQLRQVLLDHLETDLE